LTIAAASISNIRSNSAGFPERGMSRTASLLTRTPSPATAGTLPKAARADFLAHLGWVVETHLFELHVFELSGQYEQGDVAEACSVSAGGGDDRLHVDFGPGQVVATKFDLDLIGVDVVLQKLAVLVAGSDAVVRGQYETRADQRARARDMWRRQADDCVVRRVVAQEEQIRGTHGDGRGNGARRRRRLEPTATADQQRCREQRERARVCSRAIPPSSGALGFQKPEGCHTHSDHDYAQTTGAPGGSDNLRFGGLEEVRKRTGEYCPPPTFPFSPR
jgi:hypothetical protein